MKRLLLATVAPFAALAIACGGGDADEDEGAFFELSTAEDAAQAAMLVPGDLPGTGWEITAEDEEGGDNFDFVEAAKDEPSCSTFNDLSALSDMGGLFGSTDEDKSAGWSQVELTRAAAGAVLPTSVEMEFEVAPTVADVQGSWKLVKDFFSSRDLQNCIANVVTTMFEDQFSGSGIQLKLEPSQASGTPPQDGASMAFLMTMNIAQVSTIEAQMEMYFWPYANAKVSAMVMGMKTDVTKTLVDDVLTAADEKIIEAEREY